MKPYKPGFDGWGLLLFLLIMLPNFVWSAIPAPHDVLRGDSVTETLDAAASVFQILMAGALIFLVNPQRKPLRLTELTAAVLGCAALYFGGWIFYYLGRTGPGVILLLTIPPCLAFLLFAAERKNLPALISGAVFMVCHVVFSVVNFII